MKNIQNYINEGYKIMKFEREINLRTGEEIAKIEMKALDGYINTITLDDNCGDEIEKELFTYLKEK